MKACCAWPTFPTEERLTHDPDIDCPSAAPPAAMDAPSCREDRRTISHAAGLREKRVSCAIARSAKKAVDFVIQTHSGSLAKSGWCGRQSRRATRRQ
jgi:hypothetical protein